MYKSVLLVALVVLGANADRFGRAVSNDSPKTKPSIWDNILVRGANGQLQPYADSRREQQLLSADGSDSAACDDCKKVVKYIAEAVEEGAKLEEFKSTLKLLCDLLSGDEKESCKNIIDNLDVVIKKLEPLLKNPTLFCEELALCSTTNVPRMVALVVRYMAARTEGKIQANDVLCDECQFVINELREIIQQQGTEEEVKESFEGLCSYLGGSTAQKCKSIIDQYFPLLWDELIALMRDSKTFCVDLSLCQSNLQLQEESRTSMMRLMPAVMRQMKERYLNADLSLNTPRLNSATRFLKHIQTKEGKSASCFMCQVLVTGFVDVLQNSDADQKAICSSIQAYVCDEFLPSAYQVDCNDFVGLYLQAVLQQTLTQLTIMQPPLCQSIDMCSTSDVREIAALPQSVRNDIMCESCTLVSEFVQHEIGDASVQTEIKSLVMKACENLPSEMVSDCKNIADTYVPAILDAAAQYLNPENICPELHMCPSVDQVKKIQNNNEI